MNACIRAGVRTALFHKLEIVGITRGGNPSCMDRVNSSRMGFSAVEALLSKKKSVMIGIINNRITHTRFKKAVKHLTGIHLDLQRMMRILAI